MWSCTCPVPTVKHKGSLPGTSAIGHGQQDWTIPLRKWSLNAPPTCRLPSRLSKTVPSSDKYRSNTRQNMTTPSPKDLPLERWGPYLQSTLIVHVDLWVKGQRLTWTVFYNSMRWPQISGWFWISSQPLPVDIVFCFYLFLILNLAMTWHTETLHRRNLKMEPK